MSHLDPSSLKKLRKSAGLTQLKLAKRSGVPYSTLTKLEQGQIPSPSVGTVHKLADALGCTSADLMSLPEVKIDRNDNIKFVYFDIGGVLVHWIPSVQAYAARVNRSLDDVLKLFYEYYPICCRGNMSQEEFQLLCTLKLGLNVKDGGQDAAMQSWIDDVRPIVPVHKFIDGISRRYPVGLLSNIAGGYYPEYFNRKLVPNLKYKAVVKSCDLGVLKPDAEMFEVATQAARVKPQEIMFIDDSQANVAAARDCGWQAEWFDEYEPQASISTIVNKHFSS